MVKTTGGVRNPYICVAKDYLEDYIHLVRLGVIRLREIVLDIETTGLSPREGHRIVEIGCVELVHRRQSGERRQWYLNPERDVPREAFEIHGLSEEFLHQYHRFADIAEDFLDFIGSSPLIIHNAEFDIEFLNAELKGLGKLPLSRERTVDTLLLARQRFPGASAKLESLCQRFQIEKARPDFHGALSDAQRLAACYPRLLDEQSSFALQDNNSIQSPLPGRSRARTARCHSASDDELAAHEQMLRLIKSPIWNL